MFFVLQKWRLRAHFGRSLLFWAAGFSADFAADFFLVVFCEEQPPDISSTRRSPAESSKIHFAKIPDTCLQTIRAKKRFFLGVSHVPQKTRRTEIRYYLLWCFPGPTQTLAPAKHSELEPSSHACNESAPFRRLSAFLSTTSRIPDWNGVRRRGCDKAWISEEKQLFTLNEGKAFSEYLALVRNSIGKTIHWRGFGHTVNRRTLKIEIFCAHPLPKFPLLPENFLQISRPITAFETWLLSATVHAQDWGASSSTTRDERQDWWASLLGQSSQLFMSWGSLGLSVPLFCSLAAWCETWIRAQRKTFNQTSIMSCVSAIRPKRLGMQRSNEHSYLRATHMKTWGLKVRPNFTRTLQWNILAILSALPNQMTCDATKKKNVRKDHITLSVSYTGCCARSTQQHCSYTTCCLRSFSVDWRASELIQKWSLTFPLSTFHVATAAKHNTMSLSLQQALWASRGYWPAKFSVWS